MPVLLSRNEKYANFRNMEWGDDIPFFWTEILWGFGTLVHFKVIQTFCLGILKIFIFCWFLGGQISNLAHFEHFCQNSNFDAPKISKKWNFQNSQTKSLYLKFWGFGAQFLYFRSKYQTFLDFEMIFFCPISTNDYHGMVIEGILESYYGETKYDKIKK